MCVSRMDFMIDDCIHWTNWSRRMDANVDSMLVNSILHTPSSRTRTNEMAKDYLGLPRPSRRVHRSNVERNVRFSCDLNTFFTFERFLVNWTFHHFCCMNRFYMNRQILFALENSFASFPCANKGFGSIVIWMHVFHVLQDIFVTFEYFFAIWTFTHICFMDVFNVFWQIFSIFKCLLASFPFAIILGYDVDFFVPE